MIGGTVLDVINGVILKNMLLVAARNLDQQRDMVNALNVFPVPDGDTGTNMALTLNAAVKELERAENGDMGRLTTLLARGSLMGARGNSGVILSQFFRGFSEGLSKVKEATGEDLARAFVSASKTTYRAVMKPVEGTMLTVARVAAEAAEEAAEEGQDVSGVMKAALRGAQKSLADTPNILPVLKEAGVVDAGGQGLVCIFEGFWAGLKTSPEDMEAIIAEERVPLKETVELPRLDGAVMVNKYCTEFIILGEGIDPEWVRQELEPQGESLIVVGDDEVTKVHIHTDNPGEVLQFCGGLGNLTEIAIDNMMLQNQEFANHGENHHLDYAETPSLKVPSVQVANSTPKDVGIVAVVAGDGLAEIFRSLGVDHVVIGGQTMNPSTEDLVTAVNSVNAHSIIILPNNKNVIFSAQQVKELVDKKVGVVPTRSAPQGISALMYFVESDSLDENIVAMEAGMKEVKTGEITYAVRSTVAGDLQIEERDIIGLAEGKIAMVGSNPDDVALDLLRTMVDDDSSVISIYYGADHPSEAAGGLQEKLHEEYPHCEVEVYLGGQPLYYYIVSVE